MIFGFIIFPMVSETTLFQHLFRESWPCFPKYGAIFEPFALLLWLDAGGVIALCSAIAIVMLAGIYVIRFFHSRRQPC